VAAATADARIVLAAGLAATIAESVSMAAVAYTSTHAERARYEAEQARERRHIERVPELEAEEIRALFRRRGLDGETLERVVAAITGDPEVWVAVMMADEHGLMPVPPRRALRSAFVVGLAALVGSLVPLAPFLFAAVRVAVPVSFVVAGATLFAVGAYKARTTVGSWIKSGLEMTAIGLLSAMAGWLAGRLFRVT
jgi:VIT1/CCC1 family predicted Fe2+/Mn2+ transporter